MYAVMACNRYKLILNNANANSKEDITLTRCNSIFIENTHSATYIGLISGTMCCL